MSEQTNLKTCYICHKTLDATKQKDEFCEAEGRVACKYHHGVEAWWREAMWREKETTTTMTGVVESKPTTSQENPAKSA